LALDAASRRQSAARAFGSSARLSLFFHQPNHDASVECLPSCVDADHPAQYAPTTSGAHLLAKINKSNTMGKADPSGRHRLSQRDRAAMRGGSGGLMVRFEVRHSLRHVQMRTSDQKTTNTIMILVQF
jgi:hypothetical protein